MTLDSNNLVASMMDHHKSFKTRASGALSWEEKSAIHTMIDHDAETLLREEQKKIEEEFEYENLFLEHYHYAVNQKFDFKTFNGT